MKKFKYLRRMVTFLLFGVLWLPVSLAMENKESFIYLCPNEILIKICSNLSLSDLGKVSSVSKRMQSVSEQDTCWKKFGVKSKDEYKKEALYYKEAHANLRIRSFYMDPQKCEGAFDTIVMNKFCRLEDLKIAFSAYQRLNTFKALDVSSKIIQLGQHDDRDVCHFLDMIKPCVQLKPELKTKYKDSILIICDFFEKDIFHFAFPMRYEYAAYLREWVNS